jgi:hypothetical protein
MQMYALSYFIFIEFLATAAVRYIDNLLTTVDSNPRAWSCSRPGEALFQTLIHLWRPGVSTAGNNGSSNRVASGN